MSLRMPNGDRLQQHGAVLSDEDFDDDAGAGADHQTPSQKKQVPTLTEAYPADDERFHQWAQDTRTRRRLVLTAFFHFLGAAAHGSAMVVTLFWSRMNIYVNMTRQEVFAVPNATHPWDRRDVVFVQWHPSWVIFVFFALSFFFHLIEGFSLLSFLCCAGEWIEREGGGKTLEIRAEHVGPWNGWYALSLYRCCAPTR